jgi:glycosyltransferase involved in cell wall biosynthesis
MAKICIVRQEYFPWHKNLRRSAETLAREGYAVDVICLRMKGEKKHETIDGINVYRISLGYHRGSVPWYIWDYTAFFILSAIKLTLLSLRKRYDMVEVHTMPDCLVFVTLIPRLLGSKVILYMFENAPQLFMSSFNKSPNHIGTKLLRFMEKISAAYAHRIIVSDGPAYKKVLESRGIPSDKITVIPNVPDDSEFGPEFITPSPNGTHFRIVVVGTLTKRYGVQTMIKAVPLLLKDIHELQVTIIGRGEYREELEELAHSLKVEKYINFTGWIDYKDLATNIAQAHVAVAPMLHDVGMPNKLFEYMTMATPAVASALPSLVDTIFDSCVLYFQPGNEIELAERILELHRDPEKRALLSRNSKEIISKYRWQDLKHDYLKVHKECLRKRNNHDTED